MRLTITRADSGFWGSVNNFANAVRRPVEFNTASFEMTVGFVLISVRNPGCISSLGESQLPRLRRKVLGAVSLKSTMPVPTGIGPGWRALNWSSLSFNSSQRFLASPFNFPAMAESGARYWCELGFRYNSALATIWHSKGERSSARLARAVWISGGYLSTYSLMI